MIYGDRIAPESLSTVINDLHPGLDYKINLIALTEHPVGKQRQIQQQQDDEAYDSTYSDDDNNNNFYNNNNNNNNKHQFTKSFDSGQRTQSTFSDGDELVNFMNTVKGLFLSVFLNNLNILFSIFLFFLFVANIGSRDFWDF